MTPRYDAVFVILSVIVAMLASFAALDLAGRVRSRSGATRLGWLAGGGTVMGLGIWSMHFIGMLAFHLPVPMGYDVTVTLLSMLIAMIVSGFALFVVSRDRLGARALIGGGILMGLGISSMHYTGMAAMETSPPITYDPVLFSASVAIAIAAACAALFIAFTLRSGTGWRKYAKFGSAIIMGFAITGMHYTGMAAAQFHPDTY